MSEHKRHFCYAPACERISLLPLPGHKSFENRECFSHMHTRTRMPTKIIALFKECVSELLIFLSYFWTKIGRRLKKANDFFFVVAEHLLWMRTDVLCMWTRVWASWTVHQCIQLARVCVWACARYFGRQMEHHANWLEISGGVWSGLTPGWAAAPQLGSLPPLAWQLVLWQLHRGFSPSLHLAIHPWITLSDQ